MIHDFIKGGRAQYRPCKAIEGVNWQWYENWSKHLTQETGITAKYNTRDFDFGKNEEFKRMYKDSPFAIGDEILCLFIPERHSVEQFVFNAEVYTDGWAGMAVEYKVYDVNTNSPTLSITPNAALTTVANTINFGLTVPNLSVALVDPTAPKILNVGQGLILAVVIKGLPADTRIITAPHRNRGLLFNVGIQGRTYYPHLIGL